MTNAIHSYFDRRVALRRQAEELVLDHGEDAARLVRDQSYGTRVSACATIAEPLDDWTLLIAMVDRAIGAPPRADTANRYGDLARERGDHP